MNKVNFDLAVLDILEQAIPHSIVMLSNSDVQLLLFFCFLFLLGFLLYVPTLSNPPKVLRDAHRLLPFAAVLLFISVYGYLNTIKEIDTTYFERVKAMSKKYAAKHHIPENKVSLRIQEFLTRSDPFYNPKEDLSDYEELCLGREIPHDDAFCYPENQPPKMAADLFELADRLQVYKARLKKEQKSALSKQQQDAHFKSIQKNFSSDSSLQ